MWPDLPFPMKKELIIAIFVGFAIGLLITFGVWAANKNIKIPSLSSLVKTQATPAPTASPTPAPIANSLSLTIDEPENHAIVKQEKVKLSGKTEAEATIVILYEEGEKILQADQGGNFSTEITLAGGNNEITVSAYGSDGSQISQNLTLIFSTAKI